MRVISFFLLLLLVSRVQVQPSTPIALIRADQTLYRVDLTGQAEPILTLTPEQTITAFDGRWLTLITGEQLDVKAADPTLIALEPLDYAALLSASLTTPYQPISHIQGIELPPSFTAIGSRLYLMSGEDHPYTDLYAVVAGEISQLTDVTALFPSAKAPYLSASVDFISVRPNTAAFLYRARLRDNTAQEFNSLFLYDVTTQTTVEMPYSGKNPVWSPDGMWLAGSRYQSSATEPPLYHLWISHVESGEEREIAPGCNPHWSPDGAWLAYDRHSSPFFQSYTDCFANGEVAAFNLETGETILLSAGLPGDAQFIGWLAE